MHARVLRTTYNRPDGQQVNGEKNKPLSKLTRIKNRQIRDRTQTGGDRGRGREMGSECKWVRGLLLG